MNGFCPLCRATIKATERRVDGDSICFHGHKFPTSKFLKTYIPDLTQEFKDLMIHELPLMTEEGEFLFRQKLNEAVSKVAMEAFSEEDLIQFHVKNMVE